MTGYAHTIADLIEGKNQPCPYDHQIALVLSASGTKELTYRDWRQTAVDQGFNPCPEHYPEVNYD